MALLTGLKNLFKTAKPINTSYAMGCQDMLFKVRWIINDERHRIDSQRWNNRYLLLMGNAALQEYHMLQYALDERLEMLDALEYHITSDERGDRS